MVGCMSVQIRFLNLDTIEIWSQIILCCRAAVLLCCRMFSRIPGFYPLYVSSIPQLWQPKVFPDIAKCSLGDKITHTPMLRITDLNEPHYSLTAQRLTLYLWETDTQIQGVWVPSVCKRCPISGSQEWQITKGNLQGKYGEGFTIASDNGQEFGDSRRIAFHSTEFYII